jgi:hypothetical protein
MPSKFVIYSYFSALLAINLVFGFLVPISTESLATEKTANQWYAPAINKVTSTNIERLLSSGFWGKPDDIVRAKPDDVNAAEVAEQEAKKLRTQIKAIINREQQKEVLFVVNDEYHRITIGDKLPETQWTLMDVGDDWLKLSADETIENTKLLRLFAGMNEPSSATAPLN